MEAKLNFNPPGKNDFARAMTSFSQIFPIFSFHGKIQPFPKKFLTVFVINRTDKFIKVIFSTKF